MALSTIALAAPPRFRVPDTIVHAVNREDTASRPNRCLEARRPVQIVTVNVDFLRLSHTSPELRRIINEAEFAVPDGQPLVWLARYLGLAGCGRVTGPDVIDICAR